MSPAPQNVPDTLEYRHIRNPCLSYVTASSPTSTNPQYIGGQNILTSYKGYAERRPCFQGGIFEESVAFTGLQKRIFAWRRWSGTFYIMLCEVTSTASNIWKLAVGIDSAFSLIFSSLSTETFDFVVSNNFCFFGNGTDMRKFDGTTVTNWGISAPSVVISGPNTTGTGASSGSPAWANPTRIQTHDGSYSTSAIGGGAWTNGGSIGATVTLSTGNLVATNFSFSVPAGATILGFLVEAYGFYSVAGGVNTTISQFALNGQMIKAGTAVGSFQSQGIGTSAAYVPIGSGTNLFGSTWVPADVSGSTFGVQIVASAKFFHVHNSSGTDPTITFSIDDVRITAYYSSPSAGLPTTSLSGTGITAATGYQYVYCYFNSTTGHLSSPSQASVTTGAFSNKTVNVTVTASTDPQVDKIRIFRTTDGGGGQFFEIENSPVANVTGPYPDTTTDANLSVITAPTFGFNDPPPPQKGFIWFANRIWGFSNATVYFTDWEELNLGVAEEAWVSGPAGNYWNFDSEVTGLSIVQDGVLIFTAGSIYKIDGDSLDTFRRTTIAKGIGCRQRATITRLGGLTAFLANTNSVWTTDSNSLQEISREIQPTLDGIDHSQASMAFHIQGQNRWLVLADPGHQQTVVYDTNLGQWMPPWTIQCTSLCSAETSEGTWNLLAGANPSQQFSVNVMLTMLPGSYEDFNVGGVTYPASIILNPIPLINEHMGEVNQFVDIYYPQAPGRVSYLEYFGMEFDANSNLDLQDVSFCHDDDPATAAYTSIFANATDAPKLAQGINIIDKWYYCRKPTVRRVSMKVQWSGTKRNFKLYTMSMGYRIYS